MIRLAEEVRWFDPSLRLSVFPDWETLPYDVLSPHADLVGERLQTLFKLLNRHSVKDGVDVLLISASTASQRLSPREFIGATTFFFQKGQRVDPTELRRDLIAAATSMSLRWSRKVSSPFAADFLTYSRWAPKSRTDWISLTTRSTKSASLIRIISAQLKRSMEIRLLPAHEFPMDKDARSLFCGRWREKFAGDPSKVSLYKDIENGIAPAGIENYLPLFFDKTETLFDYIGEDCTLMLLGDVNEAIIQFDKETEERARFLRADGERPLLDLKELYLTATEFFEHAGEYPRLVLLDGLHEEPDLPNVSIERRKDDPLEASEPTGIFPRLEAAGS